MISFVILGLSLAFGVIVFVKMIGPDAWLIRGLRGDKLGAVVALCSILLCGALILLLLQFSLSVVKELPIAVSAAAPRNSSPEYAQRPQAWDVLICLASFCIPIATGYLLSLLYRGVYRAVTRLALR